MSCRQQWIKQRSLCFLWFRSLGRCFRLWWSLCISFLRFPLTNIFQSFTSLDKVISGAVFSDSGSHWAPVVASSTAPVMHSFRSSCLLDFHAYYRNYTIIYVKTSCAKVAAVNEAKVKVCWCNRNHGDNCKYGRRSQAASSCKHGGPRMLFDVSKT